MDLLHCNKFLQLIIFIKKKILFHVCGPLLEEYTTGVQSLLFELWPCVCASIGRVAVTASDCVLEIIDYLQLADQRERNRIMGCLRSIVFFLLFYLLIKHIILYYELSFESKVGKHLTTWL